VIPPDGSTLWALWNNTEGGRGPSAQGLWLEQDLKAADANRAAVPWIIVTSHFPLHNTMLEENAGTSARHYVGDEGEDSVEGREFTEHHFAACKADAGECTTVAQLLAEQQALIPIMEQYHVDVYDAGHVHSYEVTWPVLNGSATATNYTNPAGIVYITEGNGGVPGVSKTKNSIKPCSGKCRMKGTGGAYGRFSATDAKALTYVLPHRRHASRLVRLPGTTRGRRVSVQRCSAAAPQHAARGTQHAARCQTLRPQGMVSWWGFRSRVPSAAPACSQDAHAHTVSHGVVASKTRRGTKPT